MLSNLQPASFTEIHILLLSLGAKVDHDLAQEDIFSFVCLSMFVCGSPRTLMKSAQDVWLAG